MNHAELEAEYQRYLTLREQANEDWHRLSQIAAFMAEQFMHGSPHGGDIQTLRVTFASATWKTRKAVAQYRAWLIKQQEGSS